MGIIKIIARSMFAKTMSYNESRGELFLWGMPYFLIPNNSFAYLQKSLIDNFGKKVKDILFSLGKKHGYNATKILIDKYGLFFSGNYKFFVEQSDLVGIGTVILDSTDVEKKTHDARNINSPLSYSYLKLFGKQSEPVDHYLMGLSAGVSDALDKWDTVSFEKKCIAKGDKECVYFITDNENINTIEKEYRKNLPQKVKELEDIYGIIDLKKILKIGKSPGESNRFSFKQGRLFVDNTEGFFTALYVLVIFDKVMHTLYGEKYRKKMYEIGSFQGQEHVKNLKITKKILDNSTLNYFLRTLSVYGFGKFIISKNLSEKNVIYIENNFCPFAREYVKIFRKQEKSVDSYISGIINGFISNVMSKKVNIIETICFTQNNNKCVFKVIL